MVEIESENKWVDLAIKGISTVIGFAAAALVGSLFGPTISAHSGIKKAILEAGKLGIETVVTYEVAAAMNDEIKEGVDGYNKLAQEVNEGRKAIEESSKSGEIIYYEGEVNNG